MSRRLSWASWPLISPAMASAKSGEVVTSTTWLSGPCSAWESRSAATKAGFAPSSAITSTSEGPAGMSMAAPRQSRETWPLASVT
ncbi:hypothetical protein D3C81_354990 [compost metagenome]